MESFDTIKQCVSFITYGANAFLFGYFLNRYLEPKDSKKTKICTYIAMLVLTIMSTTIFYNTMYVKALTIIFILLISAFCFYRSSYVRKIISVFIIAGIGSLATIIGDLVGNVVVDKQIGASVEVCLLLCVSVVTVVILYFIFTMIQRYSSTLFSNSSKYTGLFVCLSFMSFSVANMIVLAVTAKDLFKTNAVIVNGQEWYVLVIVVLHFTLLVNTLYTIHRLQKEIAIDITTQEILESYQQQLDSYLLLKEKDEQFKDLQEEMVNRLQAITSVKDLSEKGED